MAARLLERGLRRHDGDRGRPAASTAGSAFCDALELAWVATSLGGTHTLVGHAASTTHRQMDPAARRAAGIADGLVRVSVGIEDVDDIVDDFERALEKV